MEPLASLVLVSALVCAWAISSVKSQHLVWFVVAGLCLGAVTEASAACQASDSATVTEDTKLTWGGLVIPTSGSQTCIITTGGTACGAGSTGSTLYGTSSSGSYTVTKDSTLGNGCTITIDVVNINTGSAALTLDSITGKYDGVALSGPPPWAGLAKPSSPTSLELGMTATYTSSIAAGPLTPSFGIKVTFSPNATTPKTSNMTASVSFDKLVTIDNVVNINFGKVKGIAGSNYTINTAGVVTTSGGGVVYGGAHNAGSMLIHGSANRTITISTGSYVNSGVGVVPFGATCAYNGGAAVACNGGITLQAAPGAAGKTLLLGVSVGLFFDQPVESTATPSFTVTVTYT